MRENLAEGEVQFKELRLVAHQATQMADAGAVAEIQLLQPYSLERWVLSQSREEALQGEPVRLQIPEVQALQAPVRVESLRQDFAQ